MLFLVTHNDGFKENNDMADFSIPSLERDLFGYIHTPANRIALGERALSSMRPIFAR